MDRERLKSIVAHVDREHRTPQAEHDQAVGTITTLGEVRQAMLEAAVDGDPPFEFMKTCEGIYRANAAANRLQRTLKNLMMLRSAAHGLMYGWNAAFPGEGIGGTCWFLVRRFSLDEQGRPASYDPFWIEDCVHDPAALDAVRRKKWPKGVAPAQPYFKLSRPFGTIEEADRRKCPFCGKLRFVIGCKELTYWAHAFGDDDRRPFVQELHVLCLDCPRLLLIARREDPAPVKLHA